MNTTFAGWGRTSFLFGFFSKDVDFSFGFNSKSKEDAKKIGQKLAKKFSFIGSAQVVHNNEVVDNYNDY